MTPKERVLQRYPEAVVWHWADGWCIYTKREAGNIIGETGWKDQRRAWRSAWNEIANGSTPDTATEPK